MDPESADVEEGMMKNNGWRVRKVASVELGMV